MINTDSLTKSLCNFISDDRKFFLSFEDYALKFVIQALLQ